MLAFLVKYRTQDLGLPPAASLVQQLQHASQVLGFTCCVFNKKANNTGYACLVFIREPVRVLSFVTGDNQMFYLAPVDETQHANLVQTGGMPALLAPAVDQPVLHCGHFPGENSKQCSRCKTLYYSSEKATIAHHQAFSQLQGCTATVLERCPSHLAGVQLKAQCGCTFCPQCIFTFRYCPNGHKLKKLAQLELIFFVCSVQTVPLVACDACKSTRPDFYLKQALGHAKCRICERCALLALKAGAQLGCCRKRLIIQ